MGICASSEISRLTVSQWEDVAAPTANPGSSAWVSASCLLRQLVTEGSSCGDRLKDQVRESCHEGKRTDT